MGRKRGGLAGIWDRNKQFITPAAEMLAGALFTPAAGAGVGAALRGLDRPGKSGIGFDIGQGIQGGLSGYGMGQVGSMAAGGLRGLQSMLTAGNATVPSLPAAPTDVTLTSAPGRLPGLTPDQMAVSGPTSAPSSMFDRLGTAPTPKAKPSAPSAAPRRVPSMAAKVPTPTPSITPLPTVTTTAQSPTSLFQPFPQAGASAANAPGSMPWSGSLPSTATPSPMERLLNPGKVSSNKFGDAVDWLEHHGKAVDLATAGINRYLGTPESKAMDEKNRIADAQLKLQQQQFEDEKRRREAMAQLLIPMYQQLSGNLFGGK